MFAHDYISVLPIGNTWRVSRSGARRALRIFRGDDAKDKALKYARERAKIVWLYGTDGRIAERIEVKGE